VRDNPRTIGTRDHHVQVARDFVWAEYPEGSMFDQMDGIGGASEIIQAVMTAGWSRGFRPSGFADVQNETAALRQHLADMKTIAFHQLKIKSTG